MKKVYTLLMLLAGWCYGAATNDIVWVNSSSRNQGVQYLKLTNQANEYSGTFRTLYAGTNVESVVHTATNTTINVSTKAGSNWSHYAASSNINGGGLTMTNIANIYVTGGLESTNLYVVTGWIDRIYMTNIYGANIIGLTNINGVHPSEYVTNGMNVSRGLYSGITNGFAGDQLVTADWVRNLLSGGAYLYNITNLNTFNTNYYTASWTTNDSLQVRTYSAVTNNQYIGGIMSTTKFYTVYSPMAVSAWISWNYNASRAGNIWPEFYYTEDGTNLTEITAPAKQALKSNVGTNLYEWAISYPTITNANGILVLRKFKVDGIVGTVNISIYGSGDYPSHISFSTPPSQDSSLGTRGATNSIINSVYGTYDTVSRVLTLPTNIALVINLDEATNHIWNVSNDLATVTGSVADATNHIWAVSNHSVVVSGIVNVVSGMVDTALESTQGMANAFSWSEGATNSMSLTGQTLYVAFGTGTASTQGMFNTVSWSEQDTNSWSVTGQTGYIAFKTNYFNMADKTNWAAAVVDGNLSMNSNDVVSVVNYRGINYFGTNIYSGTNYVFGRMYVGSAYQLGVYGNYGGLDDLPVGILCAQAAGAAVGRGISFTPSVEATPGAKFVLAHSRTTSVYKSVLEFSNTWNGAEGNLLLMKSGGHVGIQTSAPRVELDVNGSVYVSSNITVNSFTGTVFDVLGTGSIYTAGFTNFSPDGTSAVRAAAVGIATTNFIYNGTNTPDYADAFLGYPLLTLTTNMVTVTSSGGTPIIRTNFAQVFDHDMSTKSPNTATNNDDTQSYVIDLGTNYTGFVQLKLHTDAAGAVLSLDSRVSLLDPMVTTVSGARRITIATGENSTNNVLDAFSGRYIVYRVVSGTGTTRYNFYEILVWGATNAYLNLGGF